VWDVTELERTAVIKQLRVQILFVIAYLLLSFLASFCMFAHVWMSVYMVSGELHYSEGHFEHEHIRIM